MGTLKNRRSSVVFWILVLLAAGGTHAAQAVDVNCSVEDGNVRLYVPGLYYQAFVERAQSAGGPFEYLGSRSYGCTEACEYFDSQITEGATYWYRVTLIPQYGPPIHLGPAEIAIPALPARKFGSIATPNPFSERVSVRFRIPARFTMNGPAPVLVTILDAAGRVVRRIPAGAMARGEQVVHWDGRDHSGRAAPTGLYVYAIQVGASRETGRIVKLN